MGVRPALPKYIIHFLLFNKDSSCIRALRASSVSSCTGGSSSKGTTTPPYGTFWKIHLFPDEALIVALGGHFSNYIWHKWEPMDKKRSE